MSLVYIASDHRGFSLKKKIKEFLEMEEYKVVDLGNEKYDTDDDYTDFALKLGEKIANEKSRGILICGSGVGVCVAVNKIKGVRGGLCMNEKQARVARTDDDINVLCLSADLVTDEENEKIVKTFLETKFSSSENHFRRIVKIKEYETKQC